MGYAVPMEAWLAVVGGLAVVVAFLSEKLRLLPVSEPLLGLAVGVVAGPEILGWLELGGHDANAVVLEATRLLLALSLMAVALRYPPSELRRRAPLTVVVVAVVMPLMAAVSAVLGSWLLGIPAPAAWLLGAIVCPTDPVLASTVVTGEPAERAVPARLRHLLSLESGANDGLAFPLVAVGVAVTLGDAVGGAVVSSLWGVGGAIMIGALLGLAIGHGIRAVHQRHEVEQSVMTVFTLVLAVFVLGVARAAGTDAILAVFAAGLAFNVSVTGAERRPEVAVDEAINRFAVLPIFALLGVVLPWGAWRAVGWPLVTLVVAVLLLRRLPAIALLKRPLRFDWPEVAFYGWFGPIGASSLFYLAHSREGGVQDPVVWAAGTAVVAASVLVHGVTATPGRRLYARAVQGRGDDTSASSAAHEETG